MFISLLAVALISLSDFALENYAGIVFPRWLNVLLQGLVAAIIARARGMAMWWWGILLIFPGAAALVNAWQLPPLFFFVGFIFLLLLFWSTFRSQVPFYPSRPSTWAAVASVLPSGRPLRFIDIGSGLGGLVLNLARVRPDSHFVGIEIAPLPWLISRLRAFFTGSASSFVLGNYHALDFAGYDVIFAYLSPAAMVQLWDKASREMVTGSILLSYEFLIPEVPPDFVIQPRPGSPILYGWHM
ncbi:class I SAM-dependent methyltransferase [Herbaspirillum sp. RTI4]|uniref:class I SAM-dependent methyltransferase n=1 Tax=Herbaspirillum sp. RTI4 TaxID=3048640 RepID=UPI002AB5127C|nr:class I SAM-dependent methyltransferase [Herbaspirillum sp. RTI4]MDY7578573.1 class I SAM-dependent methyltransferase [Herbaspirillum sp. RTI4]MEA9981121.1 class I SAM-dependent methyltransferase [Herbaspirillum sp. RTI4]